ncbi:hypothetical protein ACFL1U_00120 [Patescibacteria group bacterium]
MDPEKAAEILKPTQELEKEVLNPETFYENDYELDGELMKLREVYLFTNTKPNEQVREKYAEFFEDLEEAQEFYSETKVDIKEIGRDNVFFPAIIGEDEDGVRFIADRSGEIKELSKKEYIAYLGFSAENIGDDRRDKAKDPLRFWERKLGVSLDAKDFDEEQIKEAWKKLVIHRHKEAQRLQNKFQYSSERERGEWERQEVIENFFVTLLSEAKRFVKQADELVAADLFNKTDAMIQLDSGKWVAIQLKTCADYNDSDCIPEKKYRNLVKTKSVTVPEYLDRGEMPLVLIQDARKNYETPMERGGSREFAWDAYQRMEKLGKVKPAHVVAKEMGDPPQFRMKYYFESIINYLQQQSTRHPDKAEFYSPFIEEAQDRLDEAA